MRHNNADGADKSAYSASRIDVTDHAVQRYLERVDGTEPYPRSAIERQVREARPVGLNDPRFYRARRHPRTGVVFVFGTSGTVTTCFRPTREQIPATEQGCPA